MTRTWEIDDKNAVPTDLVREQDFILRLRRLARLGTPHLVVNLVLSAIPATKTRGVMEAIQKSLQEFARVTSGSYNEMSNGDIFLVWEETGDAELLAERLMSVLPIDARQRSDKNSYLLTYHLPADYTKLRERSNHYVEVARAAASLNAGTAAEALKGDAARGPLTPWSLDQIAKLLDDIDIRVYTRTQPIYRDGGSLGWTQVSEEYFVSFDDLRRERFPKLDLISPEHLFFALCENVDQRLLAQMVKGQPPVVGRTLQLNLSIASVVGNVFAQFARAIPKDKRGQMTFEIHRGDIFQDFARTISAIQILHAEGFRVALDSVTPDMLPYINLPMFGFDQIKINVSRDRTVQLGVAAIRQAIKALPADKLVFFRCDSPQGLQIGRELGVSLFQGWHIDDLAHAGQNPAKT